MTCIRTGIQGVQEKKCIFKRQSWIEMNVIAFSRFLCYDFRYQIMLRIFKRGMAEAMDGYVH